MVVTLALPDRYSWVLLTSLGVGYLTLWQTTLVSKYRKAAKIPYPQAYAEKSEAHESKAAMVFNCAQRAHQNTLEILPQTLISMLVSGVEYPEITTALGVAWLAGRVIYTLGYASGDPKKRLRGSISFIMTFGLNLLATYSAGKAVMATL